MKKTAVGLLGTISILLIAVAVQDWRSAGALAQEGGRPSAPVTVTNTPLPVTIADADAAGEPFQAEICYASGPISCGIVADTIEVPATHRLTIEGVTALCELQGVSDTLIAMSLRTSVGDNDVIHYLGVTPVSPPVNTSNRYSQAQQTRMYADPGTNVQLSVLVYGLEGRRCAGSVSGVLTPVS